MHSIPLLVCLHVAPFFFIPNRGSLPFFSSILTLVYGWHTIMRDEQSGSGMQLSAVMGFS